MSQPEALFRVAVAPTDLNDTRLLRRIHAAGASSITRCASVRLYFVRGTLTAATVRDLAARLLTDPVTETATITALPAADSPPADYRVEVALLPGVTDPVASNLHAAAHRLGYTGVAAAATGHAYWLWGTADATTLHQLASGVFANPVIQQMAIDTPIVPPFVPAQPLDITVEVVPLRTASNDALQAISQQRRLALDLAEMQAIRAYFQQQERDPTDAELETLAQTWSEHCVHKTFRTLIHCQPADPAAVPYTVDGLLKGCIRRATEELSRPWVRSAFVDNAGVIAFDEQYDLAFKVETHNRPSALDPFGGAHTGVGGVVRDVLGVSARPIANTDVLCFGPPDLPAADLPTGVLPPQRIAQGVLHGIEDYGNKMGIPTVNGAIFYHPGYIANPLVFCGCLGLVPRDSHPTTPQPGDLIVVLGGRTGRDGLRGATFSSMELDATSSTIAGSAVQIGNPIQEKQVLEVVLQARDARLYHAITDCGAGGLASAVGEMGSDLGVAVQLERVPLKYAGLRPWEIWLSEAQERMVLAVPPANWEAFQQIAAGQDCETVAIGTFVASGRLHIRYGEHTVADLSMHFLHEGLPRRALTATLPAPPAATAPAFTLTLTPPQIAQTILDLLAHPNLCSREPVVRRYDHEVQGGTAIKPMVGSTADGPGDAAVLVPQHTAPPDATQPVRGVALAAGICPQYGELDPYAMAWAAVDEAMRNAVCVGADPAQVAILDNFCWGNPLLPDRLGALVRCTEGCYDAALAYGTPFISGKDSLNNEYTTSDGTRRAIPGTLLISAVGIVPDVRRTVTMDVKAAGNHLYLIGDTRPELGGSHATLLHPAAAAGVPPQPVPGALARMQALHAAIRDGLVASCHDCSEGGLAVALAEMCLAGHRGAHVALATLQPAALPDAVLLFSESLARFVVEVPPQHAAAFEQALAGHPCAPLGTVSDDGTLRIDGQAGDGLCSIPVADLYRAHTGTPATTAATATAATATAPAATAPAAPTVQRARPRVLVLHANGTNRDHEAAIACELAGGAPDIVHINRLASGDVRLADYAMLVLPGGFSYGDDLGAGVLWALDIQTRLGTDLAQFVADSRPVLGICNGFQALVKAGLLPGTLTAAPATRRATLTYNEHGQFECRWVTLLPDTVSPCIFTRHLTAPIACPVAHGEGRLVTADDATLQQLAAQQQVPLRYSDDSYPANPNGSQQAIAALCNPAGNVMGLMPHPENHIYDWQHPRWTRGEHGLSGLVLFREGIRYCQS